MLSEISNFSKDQMYLSDFSSICEKLSFKSVINTFLWHFLKHTFIQSKRAPSEEPRMVSQFAPQKPKVLEMSTSSPIIIRSYQGSTSH